MTSQSFLTLPTRTESQARQERTERMLEQAWAHLERGNMELAKAVLAKIRKETGRAG